MQYQIIFIVQFGGNKNMKPIILGSDNSNKEFNSYNISKEFYWFV